MTALAAFGALLYVPYVLRSPEHAIYGAELFQLQSARLLAETGHTPVVFPGMDFVTLWLHDVTGLGVESVARVVPLAVHVAAPLLVFGIARALRLGARASFLAGLIFVTNPAFFFLHSAFSQETLGMLLFLAAWAVVVSCSGDRRGRRRLRPRARRDRGRRGRHSSPQRDHDRGGVRGARGGDGDRTPARRRRRVRARGGHRRAAQRAGCWCTRTQRPSTCRRPSARGSTSSPTRSSRRARRAATRSRAHSLEGFDRFVAYAAPALVLLLSLAGIYLLWRRPWPRGPAALLSTLLIIGPVLFTVTAPAVVSGASELVLRAWPFLFLGVGIYAAAGLRGLDGVRVLPLVARRAIVLGVVGCLVAGGIVVGDNIGGRFPRPTPSTSAGPESVTDDAIAAAEWLSATAGRDRPIVGDKGSELVFGTFGDQQTLPTSGPVPFVAETPEEIARRLHRARRLLRRDRPADHRAAAALSATTSRRRSAAPRPTGSRSRAGRCASSTTSAR